MTAQGVPEVGDVIRMDGAFESTFVAEIKADNERLTEFNIVQVEKPPTQNVLFSLGFFRAFKTA